MARLRNGKDWKYNPAIHGRAIVDLWLGPTDRSGEFTADQLRTVWQFQRERIMRPPLAYIGRRPWAWWAFEIGEEMPREDEAVRLAELGELTDRELAALREAANEARLRIGTDSERISGGNREHGVSLDVRAVKLWETVERTLGDARRCS